MLLVLCLCFQSFILELIPQILNTSPVGPRRHLSISSSPVCILTGILFFLIIWLERTGKTVGLAVYLGSWLIMES